MNYESMSDFEINIAVAKTQGWNVLEREVGGQIVFVITKDGRSLYRLPNYCSSWGDMGPIIQEHGIDISWPEKELNAKGNIYKYMDDESISLDVSDSKEVLRAAAIVFLMSQEGKQ